MVWKQTYGHKLKEYNGLGWYSTAGLTVASRMKKRSKSLQDGMELIIYWSASVMAGARSSGGTNRANLYGRLENLHSK